MGRGRGAARALSLAQDTTTGSMDWHSVSWLTAGASAASATSTVMRYR